MQFTIDCACGKAVKIASEMAGTQLTCGCGRVTAIPSLSQLRLQAGETPYKQSLPEKIAQQLASGELPGACCVECGGRTSEQWQGVIECEWAYVVDESLSSVNPLLLFRNPLAFFMELAWRDRTGPTTEHGRHVAVAVAMRLCPTCRKQIGRLSKRTIKRLLAKVPIYKQLLDEYPEAQIVDGS